MTKVDVFSGFLGAGKTTLIKKLIAEAYGGEKLVLIENEFGDIAIDSGFLKEAGIEITEMSSGCICCSLVGDFAEALKKVTAQFHPDRILIEPSGVGKLSDVIRAVLGVEDAELVPGCATTVVDARRAKMHKRNFGEFWCDQVKSASCIVLSRTADMSAEQLSAVVAMLREINTDAVIVTTAWDELDGKALRAAMENTDTLQTELSRLAAESDDDADDECGCHDDHDHHDHHDDHHDHDDH
ncbi:MAG TPA: cobalamin biosynthesis protein CobW, partial [Clostridiales bacterium]|nr:cobalamin biosynthesis protein CobW [Clostridiales bacterium]